MSTLSFEFQPAIKALATHDWAPPEQLRMAVAAFLARRIDFLGIARTVGRVLERLPCSACDDLEAVVAYDADARRVAGEVVASTGHGMSA